MSEYIARKNGNGKWDIIAPSGNVADTVITEQKAVIGASTRNKHIAPLLERIAKLEEANATLLQGMEAQSEELGKARQLVKNLARSEANTAQAMVTLFEVFQLDAQAMVAAWETVSESEAVE